MAKRIKSGTFKTSYKNGKKVVTGISKKTGKRIVHHKAKKR
jgi:hypothetical protein